MVKDQKQDVPLMVGRAASNDYIFILNGNPIQDSINPRASVRAVIERDLGPDKKTDHCFVFGFDFGYTAEEILKIHPDTFVYIYEPTEVIKNIASQFSPNILRHQRVILLSDKETMEQTMLKKYKRGDVVTVTVVQHWNTLFPQELQDFLFYTQRIIENINISEYSKDLRYKKWTENLLQNLVYHSTNKHIKDLQGKFFNFPVVICAAGPSLDKQLPLLKKLQHKVLILAVNTSYAALHKAGINPHAVLAIESYNVKSMFDGLPTEKTNLVSALVAHPDLQKIPFKNKFTIPQNVSFYEHWIQQRLNEVHLLDIGGSVACAAVTFAIHLGCNPIIMIGQDLAFTNDGTMYAKGTKYGGMKITKSADDKTYTVEKKLDILKDSNVLEEEQKEELRMLKKIKGYYGKEEVYTNDHFTFFMSWFETAAAFISKNFPQVQMINATEGGAYINGFTHKPFAKAVKHIKHHMNVNISSIFDRATVDVSFRTRYIEELKRMRKEVETESDITVLCAQNPLFEAYVRKQLVDNVSNSELQQSRIDFIDLIDSVLAVF